MKDKLILPDTAFQATGKCTLQYTDPDTGRVLMEVSGKNHVFIDQISGAQDFQGTCLHADLLLCQGGYSPGDDIPMIPGEPIGYGRPTADGEGLYRGAWRKADSYIALTSRAKVSSKYVYDFLNTQALGRVDWIGLTAHMNKGIAYPSWWQPKLMTWPVSATGGIAVNCETGEYYYAKNTSSYIYLCYADPAADSIERSLNITTLASLGATYSTSYQKVCLDTENNRVYVLVYYRTSSAGSWMGKVVLLSEDLTAVESVSDISSGATYIQYGGAGGAYEGKLSWVYAPGSTYCRIYTYDPETAAITYVTRYNEITANYMASQNTYQTFVYRNFIWYHASAFSSNGTAFYSSGFMYTAPMYDMARGEVCGTLPPSNAYAYSYRCSVYKGQNKAHSGQWMMTNYSTSNPTSCPWLGAYTRYQVPADTPDRPEGTGMTVTYELEIEW